MKYIYDRLMYEVERDDKVEEKAKRGRFMIRSEACSISFCIVLLCSISFCTVLLLIELP